MIDTQMYPELPTAIARITSSTDSQAIHDRAIFSEYTHDEEEARLESGMNFS
jgi:hypothetical protein